MKAPAIDMLVASDRDVGFTVCGVSIGMNREEAMNAAQAYVSELEDYGDMIVGQNGEEYFAAYYEEDGIIHYAMYFTYEEDDSSGTNASRGPVSGISESLCKRYGIFLEQNMIFVPNSSRQFSPIRPKGFHLRLTAWNTQPKAWFLMWK